MALTIAYEGLGVIANADLLTNDTGGLGTGDWAELGAGTISANPDVYLYGAMSIGNQYASKLGYSYFDRVTPINFTDTYPGQFIYLWINISAKGAFKAGHSFAIRLGLANNTNFRDFRIADKNDANGWSGGWKLFVLDPTKLGSVADTGTYDVNAIRFIGTLIDTDVSVRADSIFFSQIAVGKGLRMVGTSTSGWADAVAYCTAFASRAWGVLQEREGIYYVYGGLWIGNTTQVAVTSFVDAGRIIQFGMSEYYYTPGTAWLTSYPNTANKLVIEDAADYATTFQDGVIVGSDGGRSGSQFIGDPNSLVSMTLYTGNNGSSVTKLYGTTLKDILGAIILGNNTANQYFSCIFQNCGTMNLGTSNVQNSLFVAQVGLVTSGGGILKNCKFISATIAVALNWNIAVDTSGKLDGTEFISGGSGHAMELGPNCPAEITLTDVIFTGYGADESSDACIYNNSGKYIKINYAGGTEPTIKNGVDASTDVSTSVILTMVVKDENGDPIENARAYIDNNNEAPFILDDVTDEFGEAYTPYSGAAIPGATWRVRLYGYYPFDQSVDIGGEDVTMYVTLKEDPLQI